MSSNYWKTAINFILAGIAAILLMRCSNAEQHKAKPRILISTDIGGTDPDDFQSMIHLLMYMDLFQVEGLISSPYGNGRKKDILDMIDLYEKDLIHLKEHGDGFQSADSLRKICKQGAIASAPFKGFDKPTDGSEWIIKCAMEKSDQPLWILVWGGIEDLAQALHDAPEIKENIKVYWIGGPNKKWSVNAYSYIAENHPDLWMIEANATYEGWFIDTESPESITDEAYYDNYIQGRGAMGKAFKGYYNGIVKMGDTPSVTYIMNGDPDDPSGESWGGSFSPVDRSSRVILDRNSTNEDTVAAYSVLEWRFKGPDLPIPEDSACFALKIWDQIWPGYYLGQGTYGVRYSSKKPEIGTYVTESDIAELNNQTGQYTSIIPWPGKSHRDDYKLGPSWYSDRQESTLFIGALQGARTVSKHRKAFMMDWAERWSWLK